MVASGVGGLCAWVVATVGVAALDRGVRESGGACLIEEGGRW